MAEVAVLVEFVGLPGTGKTWLAQGSARQPDATAPIVYHAPPRWRGLRHLIGEHGAGPLLSLCAMLWSPRDGGREAWRMVSSSETLRSCGYLTVVGQRNDRLRQESSSTHATHVLDQGLVQALWSVGMRAPGIKLDRLAPRAPAMYPHVVLETATPDLHVIAARLSRRGRHPRSLSGEHTGALLSELERGLRVLSAVRTLCRARVSMWRQVDSGQLTHCLELIREAHASIPCDPLGDRGRGR